MKNFVAIALAFFAITIHRCNGGIAVVMDSQAQWGSLANVVLQKCVNANLIDLQVAKNFLTTFGFSGIGQFSNLQGSVAYTSPLNMTLGANVTNANSVSNFTDTVSQLINSLSNVCASLDKSVVLDVLQRQFIEALMKLAIDSRVIDIQTAISISAGYSIKMSLKDDSNNQECYQKEYDFQRYCTTQFKGITDGFLCLFATSTTGNWTDAWDMCRSVGGTVAQILTTNSFNIAMTLTRNANVQNLWLAGRRTSDISINCATAASATYWYEDPNFYDPQMLLSNTVVRQLSCTVAGGEPWRKCALTYLPSNQFHYTDCGAKFPAMCQISGDSQEYVLVKDLCIAETVMLTTAATTYKDCIKECRNRRWCRSFNFVNSNSCQLFTWSQYDNPKTTNNANANGTCAYYTYMSRLN